MGKHSDGPKRRHNESGSRPGWGIFLFGPLFFSCFNCFSCFSCFSCIDCSNNSSLETADDLMRVNSEFVSNEIDEIDESELHFEQMI
jgi:hypothetical protein